MNKVACQYAIVRFMPLVETGEFANVGIVMIAPRARYFGFKLMTRRYGRVTKFFEELDSRSLLLHSMSDLKEELDRVHQLLKKHGFDKRLKSNDEHFAEGMFSEILRTREALVRFSEPRFVLTENPKSELAKLYSRYIERNFVTREYREHVLEKRLRQLFVRENLIDRYTSAKVGDDVYSVTFPFVENRGRAAFRVIKPLNIAEGQPSQIIERGGRWGFRVNELRKRKLLPERVLFTVESAPTSGIAEEAYSEALVTLRDSGVEVLEQTNDKKIIEFAREA